EAKKLKTIPEIIPKRTILNVSTAKEKDAAKVLQKPFTIQIAAFNDKAMAKKLENELKNKGYDTTISARDLSEKGTWYRVWVGNFVTEEQSEGLLRKLKEKYADSFVRLK
ncbi:MAG: SPOR domain-containing protein, partial [Candidatus Omnitrophica bacterium]|nr:SPOR domain-containing protein [Candidatus Omnitrophota bacterium]